MFRLLLFITLFLLSFTSFSQIKFTSCEDDLPIVQAMIFDEEQNYIGITNSEGILEIKTSENKLYLNHPDFGLTWIESIQNNKVCINKYSHELNKITIEKGPHVKKLLMEILDKSYERLKQSTHKKDYYSIEDLVEVNKIPNERLTGYFEIINNSDRISFYLPEFHFTDAIFKKSINYYTLPTYSIIALNDVLFVLSNKKDLKTFKEIIEKNEVSRMGDEFYITLLGLEDHYISVNINLNSELIRRIHFPKVQEDGRRKFGNFVQYLNTSMEYDNTSNGYKMTEFTMENYYDIENRRVTYSFKGNLSDKTSKYFSGEKGRKLGGMVYYYMQSRRTYNTEKRGVDKVTSPWYYPEE